MNNSSEETPLARYLRILEAVALAGTAQSTTEIAGACGLPVNTTHRLVRNLVEAGALDVSGPGRKDFRLGNRLLRLLHAGTDRVRLEIAVQPILDALAKKLSDTCFLARLAGTRVISVAWAVPGDGYSGYVIPGNVLPPNLAASAKSILAFQPQELLDAVFAEPLPHPTRHSVTSRSQIAREHESVRQLGYATCWNEIEEGLGAIAVPVDVPGIGVLYSVGTSGFTQRLSRRPVEATVEILRSAVPDLTRALKAVIGDA